MCHILKREAVQGTQPAAITSKLGEMEESNGDALLLVLLIGIYLKVKYPLNHFEGFPWGWPPGTPQERIACKNIVLKRLQ